MTALAQSIGWFMVHSPFKWNRSYDINGRGYDNEHLKGYYGYASYFLNGRIQGLSC